MVVGFWETRAVVEDFRWDLRVAVVAVVHKLPNLVRRLDNHLQRKDLQPSQVKGSGSVSCESKMNLRTESLQIRFRQRSIISEDTQRDCCMVQGLFDMLIRR